jgi:YVTN family beta-propeller protein
MSLSENNNRYGIVAVDKQGGRVLFLHPETLEVEKVLTGFPRNPHELLIIPEHDKAYVPIFGDGIHGDNPHPQHQVAVISLINHELSGFIELSPLEAPHTARLGADGNVYLCCENSATIAVIDPKTDKVIRQISVPSTYTHRLSVTPEGNKLFTDNEEDASVTVVELKNTNGKVIDNIDMPGGVNGISAAPHAPFIVTSNADKPELVIIDSQTHKIKRYVPLRGHKKGAQIVRFSQDGEYLIVIGDQEPVATLFDGGLNEIACFNVGNKPMDGCFSPDNKRLLIANEADGTVSIIDIASKRVIATPSVGKGCEVLNYFVEKAA